MSGPSKRPARRREPQLGLIFMLSCVAWAALVMAPPIIVMIIGLVSGTVPPESDGGVYGYGPGYPVFTPLASLAALPAAGMLFLSVRTFPLPLKWGDPVSRAAMTVFSLIMALTTGLASLAMRPPGVMTVDVMIGLAAAGALSIAFLLFVVRYILGWLHLLPRSWRVPVESGSRRPSTLAGELLAMEEAAKKEAAKSGTTS